jgi:hypothetical protein
MNHLHSALGENLSAGMTLTPAAYADLFAPLAPRLFKDSQLLDQLLDHGRLDLRLHTPANNVGPEPSVTLIASREDDLWGGYELGEMLTLPEGSLIVNPLYRVDVRDGQSVLTLTFPTPEYEEEFGACKRYLPATITVSADLTRPVDAKALGPLYEGLRDRLVILDAPLGYC